MSSLPLSQVRLVSWVLFTVGKRQEARRHFDKDEKKTNKEKRAKKGGPQEIDIGNEGHASRSRKFSRRDRIPGDHQPGLRSQQRARLIGSMIVVRC